MAEAKGQENGEEVSPPHPTLRSARASWAIVAGSGAEPRPKMVLLYFNLRRSLLLTANGSKFSHFRPEKWVLLYPSVSPKSGGTGTCRTTPV